MPKIGPLQDPRDGFFYINDLPYQRGTVRIVVASGNRVGLFEIGSETEIQLVDLVIFSDWRDENDIPFVSFNDLLNRLKEEVFQRSEQDFIYTITSGTSTDLTGAHPYQYINLQPTDKTVVLPALPQDGQFFTIYVRDPINILTVNGNGKNILGNPTYIYQQGTPDDTILNLVFDASLNEWQLTTTSLVAALVSYDNSNTAFPPVGGQPANNVQIAFESVQAQIENLAAGLRLIGLQDAATTPGGWTPPTLPVPLQNGDYYVIVGAGNTYAPFNINNVENGDWIIYTDDGTNPPAWTRFRPNPIRKPIDVYDDQSQYFLDDIVFFAGDLYLNTFGTINQETFDPNKWLNITNNQGVQAVFNSADFAIAQGETGITHYVNTNPNSITATLPSGGR